MAGPDPEHRIDRPVAHMRWEVLTFLHWSYPADVVARLLPPQLAVDTFDGRAWVAVTPFRMARVRPAGLPAIPAVSTFPETNVRTYVRDRGGRDGLWFLSLECARALTVLARPAMGLPYAWARMSVSALGADVRYTSRRRWPRAAAASRIAVRPGAAFAPRELGAFDHFLTGRWGAFSRNGRRLLYTPVAHPPWSLHRAEVVHLEQTLISACGLPEPAGDCVVHHSPAVDVRFGTPVVVE